LLQAADAAIVLSQAAELIKVRFLPLSALHHAAKASNNAGVRQSRRQRVCIVNGMAAGIDANAHRGRLDGAASVRHRRHRLDSVTCR
jgi:hypothetical protein